MTRRLKVAVLILNYNGKDLLAKYLPQFRAAVARSKHDVTLGVVDNVSKDGSAEYLRREFPDVWLYESPANRVLCSYNEAARALEQDVLLLMNNDIAVEPDFIDPLVDPIAEDPEVFFVTPKCLSQKDRSYEGSRTRGVVRFGVYWSSSIFPGHEAGIGVPGFTAHGGFGAFDREKFLALGGYDDLYLPGRLEDADICFRAQKRGWKCLYRPASVVYHEGGTSFNRRFGVKKTLVINARNTFLFMWKNLSAGTLVKSFFWLPLRLVHSLVSLKSELFLGFLQAVPRAGEALRRRRGRAERGSSVTDHEILERV